MTDREASNSWIGAAVPQFTVADLVRTAEYYRDVLGFEIAGYWDGEQVTPAPSGGPPVFAIVQRDDVALFFNRADGPVEHTRARGAYDVYFRVRGLDTLAAVWRERGAEIIDGPEDRVYAQREVVLRDCNGLVLAFGEATADRAHSDPHR